MNAIRIVNVTCEVFRPLTVGSHRLVGLELKDKSIGVLEFQENLLGSLRYCGL